MSAQPGRTPFWIRRRIFQRELGISDFSGGLNLRDSPSELANNESPDLSNVTLDERGGVIQRLGQAKKNPAPYAGGIVPQNLFEWKAKGHIFTQCGASIFKNDGTAAVQTFSTTDRVGFAVFAAAVYAIHPIDGTYSSTDGTTWAAVVGSPKGTWLEPWQNRLTAGGDPANPPRLYASAIGDATDWATGAGHGWFNDIREKDSEVLVAGKSASGVDIAAQVGMVVCKNLSTYRINDSNTGAYETLDTTVGAASAISVVNSLNETFVLHQTGIYRTTGVSPLVLASGKLQPLFTPGEIAFDQTALFAAGAKGDRVHFSLPRAGSTHNDLHLEYHPAQGWIVAGTDAASCYTRYTQNGEKLYGGSPTVAGQVYEMGTGGTDDGAAIVARYQTKWISPAGGIRCRFRKIRVFGRGSFSVFVKRDFDLGQGSENKFVAPAVGGKWGTFKWAVDAWGGPAYETSKDFWSLGTGTHVSFVFTNTATTTATGPQLLGAGTGVTVGAFAVYAVDLQFILIGI